jgi:hypothetical protein
VLLAAAAAAAASAVAAATAFAVLFLPVGIGYRSPSRCCKDTTSVQKQTYTYADT